MKSPEVPSEEEFERNCLEMEAQLGPRKDLTLEQLRDDPEQVVAAAELQRKFFTKHRTRLEAQGVDVGAYLAGLAERRAATEQTGQEYGKAADHYFQTVADNAESRTKTIESLIGGLRFYESKTEADWPLLTPAEQEKMRKLVANLRAALPRMLAQLPLDLRRKWEGQLRDSSAAPEN